MELNRGSSQEEVRLQWEKQGLCQLGPKRLTKEARQRKLAKGRRAITPSFVRAMEERGWAAWFAGREAGVVTVLMPKLAAGGETMALPMSMN